MKVPVTVKLLVLVLASTAFYTYVGQLVPQKEVQPPEVTEFDESMSTEDLVDIGQKIFQGKGICQTCHTIGSTSSTLRFPDLGGIATRASSRVTGFGQLEYLAQSLYQPDVFVVEGFNPGMPPINKPPVGLTDGEIRAVIAFLQTLGGDATVTMDTVIPYSEGAEAMAAAPSDQGDQADQPEKAAAPSDQAAGVLLARYGCGDCHFLDRPGKKTVGAASLHDVGSRLETGQLLSSLTDHETPVTAANYGQDATLAEVRVLLEHLSERKGQG